MRRTPTGHVLGIAATALSLWVSTPALIAQSQQQMSDEQLLKDFIHYVMIARYDAAELVGQQLLGRDLPPEAFTDLIESSGELGRFRSAVGEAMRADAGGDLESTAARLEQLFESGKLDRARSPDEIQRNIDLLLGQLQGRFLAAERLLTAGEYAVPYLYEGLIDSANPRLQAGSQQILIEMGSQSVMPLCAALPNIQPSEQELVANVLGLKGYRTALPTLAAVAESTSSPAVRTACQRAIERLGGRGGVSVSDLFLQLAEIYYAERPEVTSFPAEEHQLMWSYMADAPGISLIPTPIRTEVYHEAMAMRASEDSLRWDGQNLDAAALWVAANIKRSVEQAEGYDNPAYASDRRDPNYFAVASGMPVVQRVLARGLDTRNTPLTRAAIAAIEEIAGGSQLFLGLSDRRPLIEALGYPNRRVQYEAALAFGSAQPSSSFDGADRVVPILAGAIRDGSERYAAVLAPDVEQYQALRGILESEGYSVLPQASRIGDLDEAIAEVAGVDIVVTSLSREASLDSIEAVRYGPRLAATPVLALVSPDDAANLSPQFDRDPMVMIRRSGMPADTLGRAVAELVNNASGGPISQDEARAYSERALAVLRDLAVSGNPVLQVGDAVLPLIAALDSASGNRRMSIAEVLAHIADPRAQRAIAEVALDASGSEQAALLNKVAESAKRFSNLLQDRQVSRVVNIARSDNAEESHAAAALLGALGVPNSDFLQQLLGD